MMFSYFQQTRLNQLLRWVSPGINLVLIVLVSALIISILGLNSHLQAFNKNRELATQAANQARQLEHDIKSQSSGDAGMILSKAHQILELSDTGFHPAGAWLSNLEAVTPESVWFQRISYTQESNTVRLEGTATSQLQLSTLLEQIERSVWVPSVQLTQQQRVGSLFEFTMNVEVQ